MKTPASPEVIERSTAPNSDSVQRVVVPLSREELWLLCKSLRQEAERMDNQAMAWRVEGENRKATGQTWQPHIKTAITAESRARKKHDRVKELKSIFYGKRHNDQAMPQEERRQ